jgi:hypothetical protein
MSRNHEGNPLIVFHNVTWSVCTCDHTLRIKVLCGELQSVDMCLTYEAQSTFHASTSIAAATRLLHSDISVEVSGTKSIYSH